MHSRRSERARALTCSVFVIAFVSGALIGCGEDPEVCDAGSLYCECGERSECQDGLVCEDEVCVSEDAEGEGGAGGSNGAPDGAAGNSSGGAGDPDADDGPGGAPGAGGDGQLESGGSSNGGSSNGGSSNGGNSNGGNSNGGSAGDSSGGSAGDSSGGSAGDSNGGSGGEGSQFPGSCFGCYVEFGCASLHVACVADTVCGACVSDGYEKAVCEANAAFQALMACACASVCETSCADVCG